MNGRELTDLLTHALTDKRRDNSHIPFNILLCFVVTAKLKRKTSLMNVPFVLTEVVYTHFGIEDFPILSHTASYRLTSNFFRLNSLLAYGIL